MSKKIKVVVCEPSLEPRVTEIPNTLEAMQHIVGGYIECIRYNSNIDIWINEEGLMLELPFNRMIGSTPIVGTILAASSNNEGETIGLTDRQISAVMKLFSSK